MRELHTQKHTLMHVVMDAIACMLEIIGSGVIMIQTKSPARCAVMCLVVMIYG